MCYCPACENIINNPKLLRCLCTYCESCLQSLRTDDKVTCLVCKQESIFRDTGVNDYTYHHSMIVHHDLLAFDQPTYELAQKNLKLIDTLYPKGACANCSRSKRKNKKYHCYDMYELYQCSDCCTAYYCSNSCKRAHERHP